MGWLEVPSQISDNFLLSALAAATPFTFSSDVQNGLLETNRGVLFCFVLGMDLPAEYLEHGMFAKLLPLASDAGHPII